MQLDGYFVKLSSK